MSEFYLRSNNGPISSNFSNKNRNFQNNFEFDNINSVFENNLSKSNMMSNYHQESTEIKSTKKGIFLNTAKGKKIRSSKSQNNYSHKFKKKANGNSLVHMNRHDLGFANQENSESIFKELGNELFKLSQKQLTQVKHFQFNQKSQLGYLEDQNSNLQTLQNLGQDTSPNLTEFCKLSNQLNARNDNFTLRMSTNTDMELMAQSNMEVNSINNFKNTFSIFNEGNANKSNNGFFQSSLGQIMPVYNSKLFGSEASQVAGKKKNLDSTELVKSHFFFWIFF